MAARMTPRQVKQMGELRAQGMSYQAIADEVGCSSTTVTNWLDPEARESNRRYREENRDKVLERNRRYREGNPDKVRESNRRYREENRDEVLEHYRRYREENRDKVREHYRRYREENPDKERERIRRWREENPDKVRESSRRYYEENRDKTLESKATRRARKKAATIGDREKIRAVYDRAHNGKNIRCYLCGELTPKGERHVDHIVPLSRGGKHTASNLEIACATCNLSKGAKLPQSIALAVAAGEW